MIQKRKVQIGAMLILLIPLIFTTFFQISRLEAKENEIQTVNYKSWKVETLAEGLPIIGRFLLEEKTNVDETRPYLNNSIWTEGSLMALNQVYEVAVKLDPKTSEVGKELIREQLIQTVHKLEERVLGDFDGTQIALNNYPNQDIAYLLESKVLNEPDSEPEKFDIIFVLDWSGSMDYPVGNIKNPRLHAKEAIETLAKKLIEEAPDTRVRLMGVNAVNQNNNDLTGKGLNVQIDTDFFSIENDYQAIINKAFLVSPKYQADNLPYAVKYAKDQMEVGLREGATPVMIVMSDFQLTGLNDNRPNYIKFVSDYYESSILQSKTTATPIYLVSNYETISGYSYPMLAETIDLHKDERWDNRFFGAKSSLTPQQASDEIANMVNGIQTSKKWNWHQLVDSNLSYIADSFQSSSDVSATFSDNQISFRGERLAEAGYAVNGGGTFSTYKKGDLFHSFTSSQLTYDAMGNGNLSSVPHLFAPVTDAAINLHIYKGTGAKSDPANYSIVKTVVSTNYQSFSGKDYLDRAHQLASLKYKTKLSLAKAKESLKSVLDASVYDNLNFDTGITNTKNITMQFDSSKNVYDLYAEGKLASLTVGFVDRNNQPISGSSVISIEKQIGETVDLSKNQQVKAQIAALEFEGYDLVVRPENEENTLVEAGGTTANYVFEKAKSSIIVKFVNTTGAAIKEQLELADKEVGTSIDLTAETDVTKLIDLILAEGYRLTEVPSDEKNISVIREDTVVEYRFERLEAGLTIRFIDEGGDDFDFAPPIALEQKIGDEVDLTTNKEVQDQISSILDEGYDLVKRPANEDKVVVTDGGTVAIYEFTGKLVFVSAPKFIQFGSHKYGTQKTRVNDPDIDQDLVVKDTRKINTKWTVSAKMLSEMKNADQSVTLAEAIRYVYKGTELILSDGTSPVMVHTSTDKSPFNISDTWSDSETGDGLKLEVAAGSVKQLGKYSGEILWQLEATP